MKQVATGYCFQRGQCHACLANLYRDLDRSASCECVQEQTMNHTIDRCPLTKRKRTAIDTLTWL